MEEIKKVINRLKEAAELCMSSLSCNTCFECEYKGRCATDKNADIIKVMKWAEKKLESTDDVKKDEAIKHQSAGGIKGERDEALMSLYKRYNRLAALDEIGYAESEMMRDLIVEIEKLEHARNMEASNEIAKMSIEKLEKFARPMPEIKMDAKQFEEIAKDHYGKEGTKE